MVDTLLERELDFELDFELQIDLDLDNGFSYFDFFSLHSFEFEFDFLLDGDFENNFIGTIEVSLVLGNSFPKTF